MDKNRGNIRFRPRQPAILPVCYDFLNSVREKMLYDFFDSIVFYTPFLCEIY